MFEVIVLNVTRSKRVQQRVEERCRQGLCLVDGCDKQQRALGRCEQHVQQVYRKLASVPKRKRNAARARLIEEGLILANHEIYELRLDPVTAAIAEVIGD